MKGHIQKRVGKRGVTWRAWVDMPPDPDNPGKRRRKVITAATKNEVEALVAKHIASIANGGFVEGDAKRVTVAVYLERWLADIATKIRPSSHRRYADHVRLNISPYIGHLQLSKLAPMNVSALYERLRTERKLSATSVNNVHTILHSALKQALRWGLVSRNVTDAVDAPRKVAPPIKAWSKAQVGAFLAVADGHEWAALWRLALSTGMRRGELLALHWEDIDFNRATLAVRYTYSRGLGGYEIGEPKSAAGRRSIALSPLVLDHLKRHRVKQLEYRLALGEIYQDRGLVFTGKRGDPIHPNSLAQQFTRLTAKAGVPHIRIHDMRHTSATMMMAGGIHPKVVQERLGHSDVSMTLNRYSHVTTDMQREAANKIDGFMEVVS